MSLHEDPKTPAEKFALHLETSYGVQLDAYRRQALVTELETFAGAAHELTIGAGATILAPFTPEERVVFDSEGRVEPHVVDAAQSVPSRLRVSAIDPEKRTITLATDSQENT